MFHIAKFNNKIQYIYIDFKQVVAFSVTCKINGYIRIFIANLFETIFSIGCCFFN